MPETQAETEHACCVSADSPKEAPSPDSSPEDCPHDGERFAHATEIDIGKPSASDAFNLAALMPSGGAEFLLNPTVQLSGAPIDWQAIHAPPALRSIYCVYTL